MSIVSRITIPLPFMGRVGVGMGVAAGGVGRSSFVREGTSFPCGDSVRRRKGETAQRRGAMRRGERGTTKGGGGAAALTRCYML